MIYRADIDGLRAIAVLAVITFHFFPNFLSGGYLGVDIFFVISGYLITSIIIGKLKSNSFSIKLFYLSRIRRILPSLILVLLFSIVIGWFILFDYEYRQLAKHTVGSSIFLVNFLFSLEGGYFDIQSELKPLLHLWSLSIEEQYYLIWPVLILVLWRLKVNLFLFLILFILVSFFWENIFFINFNHSSFFSPFSRFWELIFGGFISLIKYKNIFIKHRPNYNLITLFALIFIAISFILNNGKYENFKILVLIPILATGVLIIFENNNIISSLLLKNRFLVWIGLISYPLYLWHWPIYSFVNIVLYEQLTFQIKLICILTSFALAAATYHFFEKPIRNIELNFKILIFPIALATIAAISLNIYLKDGLSERPINAESSRDLSNGDEINVLKICPSNYANIIGISCIADTRNPKKYVLIGDSKSNALIEGIIDTSSANYWFLLGGDSKNGFPAPFISDNERYKKIQKIIVPTIEAISKDESIEIVAMAFALRNYAEINNDYSWYNAHEARGYVESEIALKNTIERLIKHNKKIIIVLDNPPMGKAFYCDKRNIQLFSKNTFNNKNKFQKNCKISLEDYYLFRSKYIESINNISLQYPNKVHVFDTTKYFCNVKKEYCERKFNEINVFSYSDHISYEIAKKIGLDLNLFIKNF